MRFLPYNKKLKQRSRELRKNMTAQEIKLWQFLRQRKLVVNRQKPINNFIVDFYCAKLKLVIEIDGNSHYTDDGIVYDNERSKILESYGLNIMRFSNAEVMNNFVGVCKSIINFETKFKKEST